MDNLSNLRREYLLGNLLESNLLLDPIEQFKKWFTEILTYKLPDPNAMVLSTATSKGKPSARVVLLKGIVNGKFRFFTNYNSRKGQELNENPNASLLFYWSYLERQVRVEGIISKINEQENDEYFFSRPIKSRITTWVSEQSTVISNRYILEKREQEFSIYFSNNPPRPKYWGGYQLTPKNIEFWQGRSSRLHDRIIYSNNNKGSWLIVRLSP